MNVTLRQLRAFAVLARVGSFTRAADALHITQSALSAQIRELESALSVRLFDRNTRKVIPTTTAVDLLVLADEVLSSTDRLVAHAKGVASRETGRVTIAALPSIAATLLPGAIVRFRERHAGIGVTLRDAPAGKVAEYVRDGVADLGLTGTTIADRELEFESLGTDAMLAVLPVGHPLTRVRRITLSQLLRIPLIMMNRDSSVRVLVDQAAAALGRVIVPAFEATFMSTATSLVRAGLGVTLLPASAFGAAEAKDLVLRRVDDAALSRPLGIVCRTGRSLSPAAELFKQHVRVELIAWLARARGGRRVQASTTTRRRERLR